MAWERKVPHHKWKDELEEEAKTKAALKAAKKAAKDEDHSKMCPFCQWAPVNKVPEAENTCLCPRCERLYRVKCPGTILLDGDPVIVQYPGQ